MGYLQKKKKKKKQKEKGNLAVALVFVVFIFGGGSLFFCFIIEVIGYEVHMNKNKPIGHNGRVVGHIVTVD